MVIIFSSVIVLYAVGDKPDEISAAISSSFIYQWRLRTVCEKGLPRIHLIDKDFKILNLSTHFWTSFLSGDRSYEISCILMLSVVFVKKTTWHYMHLVLLMCRNLHLQIRLINWTAKIFHLSFDFLSFWRVLNKQRIFVICFANFASFHGHIYLHYHVQ